MKSILILRHLGRATTGVANPVDGLKPVMHSHKMKRAIRQAFVYRFVA
jgi:hypothetical protein